MFKGYLKVVVELQERAKALPMTTELVRSIHRTLFHEAEPDMAGKLRGPDLPADVEFGGCHRGLPYPEVTPAMERMENKCCEMQRVLDGQVHQEQLNRKDAVRVGGWVHGEIIRIHPFLDGNGRVSRICLNYFAYRYGLHIFQVFGEKDKRYIEVLDWWVSRRDPDPLVNYLIEKMIV